jgi:hypothetical protein
MVIRSSWHNAVSLLEQFKLPGNPKRDSLQDQDSLKAEDSSLVSGFCAGFVSAQAAQELHIQKGQTPRQNSANSSRWASGSPIHIKPYAATWWRRQQE